MLRALFKKWANPVTVDIDEVYKRLELHSDKVLPDPNAHIGVMDAMNEYTLRGSTHWGPAHSFYRDPQKKVTVKAQPTQFADEPEPQDEHIRSSARLSYTEEARGFGKRAFFMIIRNEFNTPQEYQKSLVFALYGLYDKDGKMKVKKILSPDIDDKTHTITKLGKIPLTPDNVRIALRYAELCAQALYDKSQPFVARTCLEQAMKADMDEVGVKILSPQPEPKP